MKQRITRLGRSSRSFLAIITGVPALPALLCNLVECAGPHRQGDAYRDPGPCQPRGRSTLRRYHDSGSDRRAPENDHSGLFPHSITVARAITTALQAFANESA